MPYKMTPRQAGKLAVARAGEAMNDITFKSEYIRATRTGVWHVTRGGGSTLCGRKIEFDLERSWPGNRREKRCETCAEKKKEPSRRES